MSGFESDATGALGRETTKLAMGMALESLNIHRADDYARDGHPWAAWDELRKHAPVHWYERDDIEPFWAVTRHADILTVSNHPEVFINGGPRLRLCLKHEVEPMRGGLDTFGTERGWDADEPPDLVFMDNPRHRLVRRQSSWAYTQGAMRSMRAAFSRAGRGLHRRVHRGTRTGIGAR